MTDKFEIATRSGWRGELRIVETQGRQVVKVALYLKKGWLSPFFEIDSFTSLASATDYARNIKDAIESASHE